MRVCWRLVLNGEQVDISTCDYLIDSDFPLNPQSSAHEPRYSIDSSTWDRVHCAPFLDARHSSLLTRTLWLPVPYWSQRNRFGEYCLLRQKRRAAKRENRAW
jgi:alpha-1,2-mannosyltransferase